MNPISAPKPPKLSLLLADVDGTLVTKEKILTDRARAAVHKLWDAGVRFAITSSRPSLGMKMIADALKLTEPSAAFNGGLFVYPDFSILEENVLPPILTPTKVLWSIGSRNCWGFPGRKLPRLEICPMMCRCLSAVA